MAEVLCLEFKRSANPERAVVVVRAESEASALLYAQRLCKAPRLRVSIQWPWTINGLGLGSLPATH